MFLSKFNTIFSTISTLTLLGTSPVCFANLSEMTGTWVGTGVAFSLEGEHLADYEFEIVGTLQTDGSLATKTAVTVNHTPIQDFTMTFRETPKGYSMIADQGSGGMVCLGDGICEGYFGDTKGNGFALTDIQDGPNSFRSIKAELQNFKAVRFFREKRSRASGLSR